MTLHSWFWVKKINFCFKLQSSTKELETPIYITFRIKMLSISRNLFPSVLVICAPPCMSYLDALELMLLLLLPYLGCKDSVWLIIRLFLTVNSLNRYESTCWFLLDWWDSGNEVPRSLRLTGTLRYVSRELLLGILKIND